MKPDRIKVKNEKFIRNPEITSKNTKTIKLHKLSCHTKEKKRRQIVTKT